MPHQVSQGAAMGTMALSLRIIKTRCCNDEDKYYDEHVVIKSKSVNEDKIKDIKFDFIPLGRLYSVLVTCSWPGPVS